MVPPAAATSPSPLDPEDYALMRRVAEGDSVAFETLYRSYSPRLLRYLQARLGQVELAEEVCQDLWLVVWHQSAQFQPRAPLPAWLFEIARRLVRKAHARRGHPAPEATPMPETDTEAESPEDSLCRQRHYRQVAQAVAALPPVLRRTITLRYAHEYTYGQIATQMECAEATVKDRLRQAQRRLAVMLRQRAPHYAMAM